MTRAKVVNDLIISQFRNHGLAAPLRPADIITLSQSGVSTEVIIALQTAVAKDELCDPSPHQAAPTVLHSNNETSPLPRAGSAPAATSNDPPRRAQEVIYTSESLRLTQDELERSKLSGAKPSAEPRDFNKE